MSGTVLSFEQITDLSSVVSSGSGLTIPAGTRLAWLQTEAQDVRYRLDGTDPTASVGHIIEVGAIEPTKISVAEGLDGIKLIEAASGAKLNVTYFGNT